jgi:Zn-dependent protease
MAMRCAFNGSVRSLASSMQCGAVGRGASRPLRLLASTQCRQNQHNKIRSSVSCQLSVTIRGRLVGSPLPSLYTSSTLTNYHVGALSHLVGIGASSATSTSLAQKQRQMHSSGRPPQPPRNRVTAGLASIGTAGLLLAGKGKYLIGALKLTKFASLGSMLVTIGTYSMFYGWPFATGMVGLILVHESGHALMMHKLGIPFKPMVFVPFLGAAVAMKERPRDAYEEALVAFGGPVLGSIGAAGVFAAGVATDSNLLVALGDFGFMINLFNLLPIGMMDGGRICGAVSPYAGVVGLGIGGAMVYNGMVSNPIFYLILLAGGWDTFQKFYTPAQHVPPNYYAISGAQRTAITGGYFALVAALMAAMATSSAMKKTPEEVQRERQLGVYHRPDGWH